MIFLHMEKNLEKKVSPQQAHLQLRKNLKPKEYVTSQQIESLFTRWNQLKQKGKLIDVENSEEPEDDNYLSYQGKSFQLLSCSLMIRILNL